MEINIYNSIGQASAHVVKEIPEHISGPFIELHELGKKYGAKTAVDHTILVVFDGEVFGFLRPNRAGKATTFKMVVGSCVQPRERSMSSGSSESSFANPLSEPITPGNKPRLFPLADAGFFAAR